jgi:lysosomal acid lipase/cholesteryl ester hydrolase
MANQIQAFVALGPVISLNNVESHTILNMMAKYPLLELYKLLGFKTLLHLPPWMNRCVGILIYNNGIYFKGFLNIVNLLCGVPSENKFDLERFGVMIAHEPGGASVNNILQW